jgi:hypothetical protein
MIWSLPPKALLGFLQVNCGASNTFSLGWFALLGWGAHHTGLVRLLADKATAGPCGIDLPPDELEP